MIDDPLVLFRAWFDKASAAGIAKPNAMTLATVDEEGRPCARVVLLSSYDARGFVFHTNYESHKGEHLARHPRAALLFWWDPLGCQVRIEGPVEMTTGEESDKYFAGRPRGSQIGAWASDQSRVIGSRTVLEERAHELEQRFAGRPVPRPPHWGGYRVRPDVFEFWEDRENRLHERIRYELSPQGWRMVRLAP